MGITNYPFGAATVSGQNVTVDSWSKQPEVIRRRIAVLAQKKFFADKVFNVSGTITGAGIVTEIPNAVDNDVFTTTDVQKIMPLGKYPRSKTTRGTLTTFTPDKWGHEFELADEAVTDNDTSVMNRCPQQMSNTLVRKMHVVAINVLDAAATTYSRTQAAAATWDATNAVAWNVKTNATSPLNVLALANEKIESEERGFDGMLDTLVLNQAQKRALVIGLGATEWMSVLDTYGVKNVFVSPRVTAGTAYFTASGQVGDIRFADPLSVRTYREDDTDSTIIKAKARFAAFVNEPYAFLQLTGL